MKYLNYNSVPDFNTVEEVAHMFDMSKQSLQSASEHHSISPKQSQQGIWGFDRWQVCQLHNKIYKEELGTKPNQGPWA